MRLRFLLLAATAWVAVPEPVRAEPISTAIGLTAAISSLGASAALAGSIGGTLVGIAVSLGLSTLAQALAPKPKAGESLTGVETSIQIGGDVARQIPVGRVLAKGHLVHVNTWGYSNTFLDQIFVLSDWRSKELVSVTINGVKETPILDTDGSALGFRYYRFEKYPNQIFVTFWDGSQTIADPAYVQSSNPPGRWTENSILSGMTYAAVRYHYVAEAPLYESGIPDLSFEFDGAVLYDRRQDSTAGGSGSQRWDDVATWAFNDNPVVATENYLRGFYRGGERILGMGVPAYDLIGETFVAAANIADEAVTLDAGGTEKRYRCASILTADDGVQHRQVLDTLLSTFAGYLYDYQGSYFCQAGAAQSPVRTITDADLVIGQPVSFAAKRSRAELVNGIHGQFLDPASGYQPQSYGAQISAADEETDGEELRKTLDLLAVPSQFQAERIAKIRRLEARAQASGQIPLGFNHVDLQVGDWITWASERYGTRTWRISDRDPDPATKAVSLMLAETNAAVFSWTAVDQAAPPVIRARTQPGNRISTVASFDVEPIAIASDDGTTQSPGLLCTWTPVEDPAVDTVEVQYRIIGTTTTLKATDASPGDGQILISEGVVGETPYEARATIRTTPLRTTTWTPWVQVTSSEQFVQAQIGHLDEVLEGILTGSGPGSIGEAKQAAVDAFDAAADAFARADALFSDVERALSSDPDTRGTAQSSAKQVQANVDLINEAVAFVVSGLSELKGQIYSAGLTKSGGGYLIRGVEEVRTETTSRVNSVSVGLDALKGTVDLIASSIVSGTVNGALLLQQVTTVQQSLDALQGSISSKAAQATVDDLGVLVTAAQQAITAFGSIVQSTSAGRLASDLELTNTAVADLTGLVSAFTGRVGQIVATTQQVTTSRLEENRQAISEASKTLFAVRDQSAAQYTELQQAIASGDTAEVTARTALAAQVGTNLARLVTEETTRANADSAQSTSVSGLTATVGANLARLVTEETTRASADAALSTYATGVAAQVGTNLARLVTEETTRASETSALSTSLSGLSATVGTNLARLVTEETTRATAISGLASRTQALETSLNDPATGLANTYAGLIAFQQAQVASNFALSSSAASNAASIGGLQAYADAINSARIASEIAQAADITAVNVKSNYGSASGQIGLFAESGPAGTYAAYRMRLVANGQPTGITVLAMNDGTSRILLDATKVLFGDGSGGVPGFIYDSATGTLSVANLIVTTSLIAPGAINTLLEGYFGAPVGNYPSNAGIWYDIVVMAVAGAPGAYAFAIATINATITGSGGSSTIEMRLVSDASGEIIRTQQFTTASVFSFDVNCTVPTFYRLQIKNTTVVPPGRTISITPPTRLQVELRRR
ncbi:hypothetical protein [uncultured Enterovirga sp.]|uniref:hypothetical protein n=1 Tax=uncultured Enterovirga sp. TaxID=2026352 RepID=UPI0035CAD1E6